MTIQDPLGNNSNHPLGNNHKGLSPIFSLHFYGIVPKFPLLILALPKKKPSNSPSGILNSIGKVRRKMELLVQASQTGMPSSVARSCTAALATCSKLQCSEPWKPGTMPSPKCRWTVPKLLPTKRQQITA